MHDWRQCATGGYEASGHVPVRLGIGRKIGRGEQPVESLRRLDRIEPIALVDGRALRDRPAAISFAPADRETARAP